MEQIGKCDVERQTKLSELIGRITDICHILGDNRVSLNSLSDRLMGATPECQPDSVKPPTREGVIGQLEDEVDKLKYQVDEIKDAVNRINKYV